MKILGIVCSPRLNGNTEILMKEALKSAKDAGAEIEMFKVSGKVMYPCDACESCSKTRQCRIEDDMKPLYPKMLEADGIIFGTPIYFWSICAQAKIIIDRTYVYLQSRLLRNKIGAAIIVTRRVGGTSACSVFGNYFNIQRMISAGYAVCFGGDKGEVLADKRGMAEARAVGRVVVRHIKRVAKSDLDEDIEKRMEMPSKESPR
jgi:multimeric flavodoxin WrbA